MDIHFTTQVFKEGRTYVAHTPQLDVSSCANTKDKAVKNLREAVRLFLEEAANMGTLEQILEEAGYLKKKTGFTGPILVGTQELSLPLPQHAEP
jgi:predicted RNase H-like HicB family nuclease